MCSVLRCVNALLAWAWSPLHIHIMRKTHECHNHTHARTHAGLNLNETMLSEYMNSAGYTSQIVGKWHLGFTSWEHTPTFRGFSSFYGFYGCAQDYYLHGTPGVLDFHHDKGLRCGENCSEPQFDAVGNCSLGANAKDYCTG